MAEKEEPDLVNTFMIIILSTRNFRKNLREKRDNKTMRLNEKMLKWEIFQKKKRKGNSTKRSKKGQQKGKKNDCGEKKKEAKNP